MDDVFSARVGTLVKHALVEDERDLDELLHRSDVALNLDLGLAGGRGLLGGRHDVVDLVVQVIVIVIMFVVGLRSRSRGGGRFQDRGLRGRARGAGVPLAAVVAAPGGVEVVVGDGAALRSVVLILVEHVGVFALLCQQRMNKG